MENKIMKVEASCENQQEGLAAVVTEMHSRHNILRMSPAGQAVMETNLLSFGGDKVAIGSLYFIIFPGKLNPQQEEGEALEGPWNKSETKILINIRVPVLAQPFTAFRPRTATQQ